MYRIGIDLGGTNIAVGIVDEWAQITVKGSVPTCANEGTERIVRDMAGLCMQLLERANLKLEDISGIGIGCPGTIDTETKTVVYSNNIRMSAVPLCEMLAEYMGDIEIRLENDANAAAYGEYAVNGNGAKSFVFITLGTGVGSGVILNGELYRGFNGAGAELGHSIIEMDGEPCSCGSRGCWEAYASATALIRQTERLMKARPESLMNRWAREHGGVSGKTAFECARLGDAAAMKAVEDYIRYVGTGLVSVINIFQPELVLIGGGISREKEYLLAPVREYVYERDFNKYMRKTRIECASLLNDAGIIGAALLK